MRSPRPDTMWVQLFLPLGLTVEQVVDALRAMATLYGSPRIVVETISLNGQVQWWIGAPEPILRSLQSLLPSHLPGAQFVPAERIHQPMLRRAVSLVVRGYQTRSLNLDHAAVTSKAVLQVLAETHRNERLVVQVILGERLRPSATNLPPKSTPQATEQRRLRTEKVSVHGFGCTVRFGVSGSNPRRARQLLGLLLAAVRNAEAPRIALQLQRQSARSVEHASSPWRWPLQLSVRELACLLGWPVGDGPFPGLPAPHPRPMPPDRRVATTGLIVGDSSAPGPDRALGLSVDDSLRHHLLLGATGTGKSTAMANLAMQAITAGHGVVVIDPKRSLVEDLIHRVPVERQADVVILDPTDEAPIGVNPLVGTDPELAADTLVHLMRELYAENWGPRTHDILHASLLTLARRGDASLIHVPLLLTNAGFRRSVIGRVVKADPMGLGSFWGWYESISEAERQSAIAPVLNKVRPLLMRPGLRAVLGQVQPRFDLDDVFTHQRILLVSLSKGQLGPEGAQLLGAIVVNLCWQAATRRMAGTDLSPVLFFIDEMQDYLRLPGDLGDALATARGFGVSFTLGTQSFSLLPPRLRSALHTNARSKTCFALSYEDAVVMARGSDLAPEDFTALGRYQAYASLLSAGTPTGWASVQTRPLPPPRTDAAEVRRRSREAYGRPLSDVETGWAELAGQGTPRVEPLGRQEIDTATGKGGVK